MRYLAVSILLVLPLFATGCQTAAENNVGIVLMHGKRGTAMQRSPLGPLISRLKYENFFVATPDMPWHRHRWLEKDYMQSMAEIDNLVADLKSRGATKIVVGGHSMGANAALGYGARRGGLAGVLAIAPGHSPGDNDYQLMLDNDYQRAREMVEAGKGEDVAVFRDVNQMRDSKWKIKARVYLSWYDPQGSAPMKKNTAGLKPGTALMWVEGQDDSSFKGEYYAFDKAPAHPKNVYVIVPGGHGAVPRSGADKIIAWLKGL